MDETTPTVETPATEQAPIQEGSTQEAGSDQEGSGESQSKEVDITTLDPSTLTPELQELHKSLLGDYTKKTQEISEYRNKAAAFEELVNAPGFSTLFDNLEKHGTFVPEPQSDKQTTQLTGEEILTNIVNDPNWLPKYIQEQAQQLVTPLADREAQREADTTIERLNTKYPDFKTYENEIAKVIEKSNYSIDPEDAYKLVTYDKVHQAGATEGAKAVEQRIQAAQAKGSPAQVVSNKATMTIKEAFQAAKKAHGV